MASPSTSTPGQPLGCKCDLCCASQLLTSPSTAAHPDSRKMAVSCMLRQQTRPGDTTAGTTRPQVSPLSAGTQSATTFNNCAHLPNCPGAETPTSRQTCLHGHSRHCRKIPDTKTPRHLAPPHSDIHQETMDNAPPQFPCQCTAGVKAHLTLQPSDAHSQHMTSDLPCMP